MFKLARSVSWVNGLNGVNLMVKSSHHNAATVPRVLITGGMGQLGPGLTKLFAKEYGRENVLVTDIVKPNHEIIEGGFRFAYADVLNLKKLRELIVNNQITTIIHLSALLSAVGERNVHLAMKVNVDGMQNILELGKDYHLQVFIPSTIGAFGPESPRNPTPDLAIQRPKTIYGVSKVYAELLGEYFAIKYGVDFRCLRFPGVISADTKPGGGTTDYAVSIFNNALKHGKYECYLRPDTRLPMMYIDDCLQSVLQYMKFPQDKLKQRTYNVTAMSFTPDEVANEIRKHIPDFKITYNVDSRQSIADSWPMVFDDSNARRDWQWDPKYDLKNLVIKMLDELKKMQ